MTAIPRALVGPVWAMARPRRPAAEIAAVREAAEIVRAETGLSSPPIIARVIADRVVVEMLSDIERDPDDALSIALAAVAQQLLPTPFCTLATCPEIDTVNEYVERRLARLRARSGRHLTELQRQAESETIASELTSVLSRRYLRHLRCG